MKKLCKKCGIEKPLEEMVKAKTCKDGYAFLCKLCDSKRSKQWRENNKERYAATNKLWRENNKERHDTTSKQWRQTERGRLLCKLSWHRRKQRKKNFATDHDLTIQQWFDIVATQNNQCALCGEYFPTEELTADHIYPLKLGGLFVKENVQAACGPCNSRKGTKTMEEYLKIYPRPNNLLGTS